MTIWIERLRSCDWQLGGNGEVCGLVAVGEHDGVPTCMKCQDELRSALVFCDALWEQYGIDVKGEWPQ